MSEYNQATRAELLRRMADLQRDNERYEQQFNVLNKLLQQTKSQRDAAVQAINHCEFIMAEFTSGHREEREALSLINTALAKYSSATRNDGPARDPAQLLLEVLNDYAKSYPSPVQAILAEYERRKRGTQ